jgi:hypothetical protein
MHRDIMLASPGEQIDHIDHDTLNNQKSNLRKCSAEQNSHNRRLRRDSASGFKGVSWSNDSSKWQARIMATGKAIHLGSYIEREDAARAYDAAAVKYHGKFAMTNRELGLLK